jgi:hypothetical protein
VCWGGFGETLDIQDMALEKFRIKNNHGKFILQIAMDWGREGGPLNTDYQNIATTAWPHLLQITGPWEFDNEREAQKVLKEFKQLTRQYWIRIYTSAEDIANGRGDFKVQNQIIQQLEALEYAISKE